MPIKEKSFMSEKTEILAKNSGKIDDNTNKTYKNLFFPSSLRKYKYSFMRISSKNKNNTKNASCFLASPKTRASIKTDAKKE
jgi:hypothetical protein